jgi:hypothetical protein
MEHFINRRWLIIPATEVENINFGEILENAADTLRYSVDGTKTFIKYNLVETEESQVETVNSETGESLLITIPAGIYGRPSVYKEEYSEYTHAEILDILSTEEWTEHRDL